MTKAEQRSFVVQLTRLQRRAMLAHAHKWPADWGGIELRQWIADFVRRDVYPLDAKRRRAYNNAILVLNL